MTKKKKSFGEMKKEAFLRKTQSGLMEAKASATVRQVPEKEGLIVSAEESDSVIRSAAQQTPIFSKKGQELIKLYEQMVREGYDRTDHIKVDNAFSDFELRAYRIHLRPIFDKHAISTVLDYGCGGSDWRDNGFDDATGQSAVEYFKLKQVYRYEPARNLDERQSVDCVISFDVLEHIFISDVPSVLRDMFSYATKLIVINVACYPAAAKLPNGENAHVTVRNPIWWKGMVDSIAVEYPDVIVYLICSTGWRKSNSFPPWSGNKWLESNSFVINE